MDIKKILLKIFSKKKYLKYKSEKIKIENKLLYETEVKTKLEKISKIIKSKNEISFLHSGHLGDVINALLVIKEISKNKKCNYYVEANKHLPPSVMDRSHPSGKFFLTDKSVDMLLPLLKKQKYLNIVEKYNNQQIDVNLNFVRNLPLNSNLDSVRWYFHLTGIHSDMENEFVEADPNKNFENNIVIIRSARRKNQLINYKFLNKYENILFIGLEEEYLELKKEVNNLTFHHCKDFLEMAQIIKSCKLFIGNLSLGYALAEAMKVPRLLEAGPNFPLQSPNGKNGYDFYFQQHFEKLFEKIYLQN